MKLRTRRILFWSLIPCFLIGGTGMVLYSQGYRVDVPSREVTKVGALYVRGYPRTAHVTLDGQPLDTGSWWPLQSGTLIGGLVPGTYKLHAEADGYRDWDADVVVRATLVTERKSLTLFPTEPSTFSSAPDSVTKIDVPDSLSEVVVSSDDNTYAESSTIFGKYVGTARGRIITTSQELRQRTRTPILRIQLPSSDSATTVAAPGTLVGLQDDTVLVQEKATLVVGYDVASADRSVVASSTDGSKVARVLRTGSYDTWSEGEDGEVLAIRPRGSTGEPLLVTFPSEILSIEASASRLGILDDRGSLWLVDPGNGSVREVGHRAGWAAWNPDGSAVMAYIGGELEVIPLKSGISHGVLTGTFTGKVADIGRVRWYPDDEHVLIELGDELAFVDIISGGAAEQHAYRMPLPRDWAFDAEDKILWTLGRDGTISSYQLPD